MTESFISGCEKVMNKNKNGTHRNKHKEKHK